MLSSKLLVAAASITLMLSGKKAAGQNFCIHGINYSPRIGPDWVSMDQRCKSSASVQEDMNTLAKVTGSIRLFGLGDCDQSSTVVPAAINAGLSVSLGLWVSGDDAVFESELLKLNTLIQQNVDFFTSGNIVDIHVGSEAIYRNDVSAAENIADLQRVKTLLTTYNLNVPVTIAEIGDVYLTHPELIDAVDFVQANGFPFWEKIAVENAVSYFASRMEPLYQRAIASDKKMVIGETGWASDGYSPKSSEASPSKAARYFYDFYHMAKQQNLEFFYFEAFDEKWKRISNNDTVEGHFGLFYEDRTLKPEIAELTFGSTCTTGSSEEVVDSSASSSISGTGPYQSGKPSLNESTTSAEHEECQTSM